MTIDNYCNTRLRIARLQRGLTQTQLAARVDRGQGFISGVERLRIRPRPDEARAIADVLGVSPDVVTGEV